MPNPRLLVVLSSQNILPATGNPTGWYLPEFAHPYYKLADHVDIIVASPKGGAAPVDPYSVESTQDDEVSQRFYLEKKPLFEKTLPISSFVGKSDDFDAIFYVGGHGRKLHCEIIPGMRTILI
jgi:putative intracellular protease/amidase